MRARRRTCGGRLRAAEAPVQAAAKYAEALAGRFWRPPRADDVAQDIASQRQSAAAPLSGPSKSIQMSAWQVRLCCCCEDR